MGNKSLYQLQKENAEYENIGNKAVGCLSVGFMGGFVLFVLILIFAGLS